MPSGGKNENFRNHAYMTSPEQASNEIIKLNSITLQIMHLIVREARPPDTRFNERRNITNYITFRKKCEKCSR